MHANNLTVAEAQGRIRDAMTPITATEIVDLKQALGRVLAHDVVSPIDVPPHDNSAMDGYAFSSDSLLIDEASLLKIIGSALAGKPYTGHVNRGECVRIMTGAVLPAPCDTVVPIEKIESNNSQQILIPLGGIASGSNCRRRGEDLAQGGIALQKGKLLRPADLGLIASLGIQQVLVVRRLRVAFFSTGDELHTAGQLEQTGQLYDSNRYTLHGMLTRLGCETVDLGIVRDDSGAIKNAFKTAAQQADVVITSGGVSVGDADVTRRMMEEIGEINLWQIAMRPGRPLAFGMINTADEQAYWFGLPGNPVAAMVSFYIFVRDALLQMMGATPVTQIMVPALAAHAIQKRPGRTEYCRGIVTSNPQGQLQVSVTGAQGSGILRSMSEANCLIVLGHDQGDIGSGEVVQLMLFEALI